MPIPILLARIVLWTVPALAAITALLALAPWILGIPGDPNAGYAEGWWLGLLALFGYLAIYAVAVVLWVIAGLLRISALASFAHGMVWLAVIGLLAIQLRAWTLILSA